MDAFITSINVDGTYGRTKRVGNSANEISNGVAVDGEVDVWSSWYYYWSMNPAQDWGGTENMSISVGSDLFVTHISQ